MSIEKARDIPRREFLKLAGAAGMCGLSQPSFGASARRVCLVVDPEDAAAASAPAMRAMAHLSDALGAKGVKPEIVRSAEAAEGAGHCVVVANANSPLARGFPRGATSSSPESFEMTPGRIGGAPAVLVSARDPRGLVYALLESAERVRYGGDPFKSLQLPNRIEEEPANEVRGVGRYFCSELEDKLWYYDREFWSAYLDHLVVSRFNRFTFAFGLEYDFPRGVTDDYFHFFYPYLVDVPGYPQVRVLQLTAADGVRLSTPKPLSSDEREKNLETLRFV